jgi:hypothetical protein
VLRAAKLGIPVAIVNQGGTRGDDYAALTIDAPLGTVLPELVRRVTGATPGTATPGASVPGVPIPGGSVPDAAATGAR